MLCFSENPRPAKKLNTCSAQSFALPFGDCLPGNGFTSQMHEIVLKELESPQAMELFGIKAVLEEAPVQLAKNGSHPMGKFDFLAETKNGFIGFEVLTRPTKGKILEKLAYADTVDRFVFVFPEGSLGLYRKPAQKIFIKQSKLNRLERKFSRENVFVWMLDVYSKKFTKKGRISEVFNVEQA